MAESATTEKEKTPIASMEGQISNLKMSNSKQTIMSENNNSMSLLDVGEEFLQVIFDYLDCFGLAKAECICKEFKRMVHPRWDKLMHELPFQTGHYQRSLGAKDRVVRWHLASKFALEIEKQANDEATNLLPSPDIRPLQEPHLFAEEFFVKLFYPYQGERKSGPVIWQGFMSMDLRDRFSQNRITRIFHREGVWPELKEYVDCFEENGGIAGQMDVITSEPVLRIKESGCFENLQILFAATEPARPWKCRLIVMTKVDRIRMAGAVVVDFERVSRVFAHVKMGIYTDHTRLGISVIGR